MATRLRAAAASTTGTEGKRTWRARNLAVTWLAEATWLALCGCELVQVGDRNGGGAIWHFRDTEEARNALARWSETFNRFRAGQSRIVTNQRAKATRRTKDDGE